MTREEQAIIDYAEGKIEAYKKRANQPRHAAYADELKTSAQTLGVLVGDIRAGLHLQDEVDDPAQ